MTGNQVDDALRPSSPVAGRNGKTLLLRQLSVGGAVKLKQWLKFRPLEELRPHLQGLPPEVQTKLCQDAMKEGREAAAGDFGTNPAAAMAFASVEGVRQMVKHMAEIDHPGLSDQELREFVDETNLAPMIVTLNEINGGGGGSDPSKGSSTTTTESPATQPPRRKR